MSLALRRSQRATQISAAARTITQRAPVTLTLARHRAQPTAATIIRLTACAVFAYLIALPVPETSPPVLAPLTALLVLQVSIYQTLYSAVRRVAAVVTGVLIALGLSRWIGFTWWSLGLTITLGLAVGYALRLREAVLEVPISAMLILSVGSKAAATSRITETLIGTAAGLIAGLVLTAPQVEPAEEAIADLARTMADLLDRMAAGLNDGSIDDSALAWLDQARALGNEITRVDVALQQAEESTTLNPRSMRLPYSTVTLRQSLETLEHSAITVRILARSLVDTTRLAGDDNPVNDPDVRRRLADTLRELSAAVRTYGSLATELDPRRHDALKAELERHLAAAHDQQDRLSELLATAPAARPVGWPLRGEVISHLDRLRSELEAGVPDGSAQRRRYRPRRWPRLRGQRVPTAFRRLMRQKGRRVVR
ncbi:MAG: aromatic acid exporter family protein [Trebonia sp.]|uniref:FUSC family protein n=1 Tax=Trebonia sp. TaxID=2767075 RepID=UPI003C92037F